MKTFKALRLCAIALLFCSCSHWNWVMKNKDLVREEICTPDSITETIIQDHYVPVIEIDTGMLQILNLYESQLIDLEDSVNNMLNSGVRADSILLNLKHSNFKLKSVIYELRELAKNTKVREIIKTKPYPVYFDRQSTLTKLDQLQSANKKIKTAVWILSFIVAGLVGIIVYIIKK